MTTIDEVKAALADARAGQEAASAARVAAVAALREAEADLAAAQRAGDRVLVTEATAAVDKAKSAADEAQQRIRQAATTVSSALGIGVDLTDPRDLVGRLGADVPVLMFPVRLETRFHTSSPDHRVGGAAGGAGHQLWVRVFPDTASIDTFSPELTTSEVADAKTYWAEVWRAAGDEAGERAAWRALVASHGSGRASWVVDSYQPTNQPQHTTRQFADEVFLVVSVPTALAANVQAAVTGYWTAWWRAGTNAVARTAALTALEGAVGAASAQEIAAHLPVGSATEPLLPATRATAHVTVAVVQLPDVAGTLAAGWNRAPRAVLLPDRFVLVLESGPESAPVREEVLGLPVPPTVFTGPDPLAPADQQIRPVEGRLELPDELAWLADFPRAAADGLGFVVNLTPDQARSGFDRVYVVGLRALEDPADSAAELSTLLKHHARGRSGLSVVAQGTPTNNTEGTASGYVRGDDADASFDSRRAGPVGSEPDPRLRTDGQWLTDLLGLTPGDIDGVGHVHGLDLRDARAMQTLLWPATMGYLLTTMLEPLLDDDTVEEARWFFSRHVRGRGELPAIRIGTQPYGLLATTAFSRRDWLRPGPERNVSSRARFLHGLQALLTAADADWAAAVNQVPSLGAGGAPVTDAHQTLLGVLGLHPTSAEFQYRYAEGLDQLVNQANLQGFGEQLYEALIASGLDGPAFALLAQLGSASDVRPPLLDLYFLGRQSALTGPLVDDRPVSEQLPVRVWTGDGRNYLAWLHDAAASLDTLRSGAGLDAGTPDALLFLLARHALTLGYSEGARELHSRAGYSLDVVRAMRREPPFVHVAPEGVSESRYEPLYRHDPLISPGQDWSVAAQIGDTIGTSTGTAVLSEQVAALGLLKGASTARLERALVEHLDTVSYRLDAWQLGLVHLQLEQMRAIEEEPAGLPRGGLHLGAYGWLEHVRPKTTGLVPAQLSADLATVFADGPALLVDPSNGGHLLAPSLNQAVTASVLRSAYLANASAGSPDAMAVNLSSARVRGALDLIEGIRAGQSLGALLGYELERGLHDRSGFAEVDVFVFALRRKFPLAAEHLQSTATAENIPIEAVQARDVVDGLALVEYLDRTGALTYPFGLTPAEIPPADAGQQTALAAELDHLRDLRDAVGDLALAEAVHHAAQGGADRAGATLDAFQSGRLPPEVEVVRTPSTGVTLTHRVGLHLDPAAAAPGNATPRGRLQPAVDAYLADALPALASVACRVSWDDPVLGTPQGTTVTLADLGLRPIDVLELLRGQDQAMTELDDRVIRRVLATSAPRPDARLHISYRNGGGHLPVFDVAALAAHLRVLVSGSRPLRASDVVAPGEATTELDNGAVLDRARLVAVQTVLTALSADVTAYLAVRDPLLADVTTHRAAILAGVDASVDGATGLLERGASLAVPGSGWGQALLSRQQQYAGTIGRLRTRAAAWQVRIAAIDAALGAYDLLPGPTPVADRLAELARIESMIAPALAGADPDPVVQRNAVGGLRDDFVARRLAVLAVADGAAGGLAALRTAVLAVLPFTDVDSDPFELDPIEQGMISLVQDVVGSVHSLGAELARRAPAAQTALDAHTAALTPPARVEALQECARALMGDTARLVPIVAMPATAAAEWSAALTGVPTLLKHLTDDLDVDFPVEDWLHSAARVRAPVLHLEQASLLGEALGRPEQALKPIQLPRRAGDRWLALEHPAGQDLTGEHLLYTAVYPVGFATATVCGLLIDEWTEVLPSDKATAGLAFNYDQPSSEAPQAMLLVTPATGGRTWTWDDLRQAVPDTMRLARQRAVEPVHLDAGARARFLPATVSAVTQSGISISLALAINNGLLMKMEG